MIKIVNNQRGSAFVITLFLIVIISIIGVSLLSISSNSLKQVDYERTDQAVFYIAEAGVNLAKLEIQEEVRIIQQASSTAIKAWITAENERRKANKEPRLTQKEAEDEYRNILNSAFTAFNTANSVSNSHAISTGKVAGISVDTILPLANEPLLYRINITSTGSIVNAKEREVIQAIEIEPRLSFNDGDENDDPGSSGSGQTPTGFPDNYAAIVLGDIDLSGSGSIIGGAVSKEGNIKIVGRSTGRISGDVSIQAISNITVPNEGRNTSQQEAFINNNYKIVPNLNIDPSKYLSPNFFPDDKFLASATLPYASKQTIGDQYNRFDVIDTNGNYNAPASWRDRNYTLNLSSGATDIKFRSFNVSTGENFIIDVGNQEVNLYIDELNISNGKILIRGSGKLNLYVKDLRSLTGPFNEGGNPAQLNIYHQGTRAVNLGSHTKMSGSFINKSGNLTLTGGAAIYGNIVSGGSNISISGGVPTNGQYIIAPNARLNLTEGGNITGIVVVKDIISSGGTNITYGGPVTPLPPGVGPDNTSEDFPLPDADDFWIDETSMVET